MPAGETYWDCTVCLELGTLRHTRHPEQRTGVKQEGLAPTAATLHGQGSPRVGTICLLLCRLPKSGGKPSRGEGESSTAGMAGWEAAQTGAAPGIPGKADGQGRASPSPFSALQSAVPSIPPYKALGTVLSLTQRWQQELQGAGASSPISAPSALHRPRRGSCWLLPRCRVMLTELGCWMPKAMDWLCHQVLSSWLWKSVSREALWWRRGSLASQRWHRALACWAPMCRQ